MNRIYIKQIGDKYYLEISHDEKRSLVTMVLLTKDELEKLNAITSKYL